MNSDRILTAEAVTCGHADKLCDLIADSILDAILESDLYARVSCDVLVTTGMVVVAGQITTKCYVDIAGVVRRTLQSIGYDSAVSGFDYKSCAVVVMLEEQAADIAVGVDRKGAGDQSVVVGYATAEGDDLPVDTHLMPVPAFLANRLAEQLAAVRQNAMLDYLHPDGKVQISIAYEEARPVAATHVVVSAHHREDVPLDQLRRDLKREVVVPVLEPTGLLAESTEVLINPVGRFSEGGPRVDCGLSGRKITVDCYGAACPHGGSSFSGKDPTKPDRSGAYGARWAAKNLVGAGLARRCAIEVAYVIGLPDPIAVTVETFGTGTAPDAELTRRVRETFDLSLAGIIEALDLRRPLYSETAAYGHFGRTGPWFTWENLDRVAALKGARARGGRGGKRGGSR
jgi:S-adenosylmethionine synthetase